MDVCPGGTRAVLINDQGQVVASAASEHAPFRSPYPGWAEQDPEGWWRAAQAAIREGLATSGIAASDIGAIGLTGQRHGAVMLDAQGQVLRPSLIWCDQRTDTQCHWLDQQIGRQRLIE